jgi:hypothetical protein
MLNLSHGHRIFRQGLGRNEIGPGPSPESASQPRSYFGS